jgi:hypothetical protein
MYVQVADNAITFFWFKTIGPDKGGHGEFAPGAIPASVSKLVAYELFEGLMIGDERRDTLYVLRMLSQNESGFQKYGIIRPAAGPNSGGK